LHFNTVGPLTAFIFHCFIACLIRCTALLDIFVYWCTASALLLLIIIIIKLIVREILSQDDCKMFRKLGPYCTSQCAKYRRSGKFDYPCENPWRDLHET